MAMDINLKVLRREILMDGLNTRAIVLAAGKSTRFRTKKSKILFTICGQTMLLYPLKALEALGIPMTLVLGYQGDVVKQEVIYSGVKDVTFVFQEQQLGTGHAVACTQSTWDKDDILILYGDMPLLTKELIQQLIDDHKERNATISFLTSFVIDPTGYGRVLEQDGKFQIVEEKDCTEEQRYVNRINAGIYMMKRSFLEQYLPKLGKSSVTGEIYLPELVRLACDDGLLVHSISVPYDNVRGVNTLQELWSVEQIKRSESIKYWMSRGVRFELAQSIHIDIDVEIAPGSFIGTGVHLLGKTKIGEECFIGAFSIIEDSIIGDTSVIHSHSVIQRTKVGHNVHVGPFARLRDNSSIGNNVEIGNFVELKESVVGDNSKTRHLSYVSHATIGENVRVGAGAITCNYDGVKKNMTVIEDNAFVGSDNTLIAPIKIGKGAFTASGSILNQDVPADSLAIARPKQENKNELGKKLREDIAHKVGSANTIEVLSQISDEEEEKDDEVLQFTGAMKTKSDRIEF
jgi:bifunctional UDP-N-acetylglucosamine pyrophosphorylase/glucosamine-1-phosphate N-acetyltransferase